MSSSVWFAVRQSAARTLPPIADELWVADCLKERTTEGLMRAILGTILVLLLIVAAVLVFNAWPSGSSRGKATVGTSGTIDTERARERGAELGEKAAVAAQKVEESAHEAALTTKIKAKMALDDTVKARAVDVTTRGTVVTVSGTVDSKAEHDRALALARETSGVSGVVDHLDVRR
jgi:hypothetical protein